MKALVDKDFIATRTSGFEDLLESLEGYSVEEAAEHTGVPAEEITQGGQSLR